MFGIDFRLITADEKTILINLYAIRTIITFTIVSKKQILLFILIFHSIHTQDLKKGGKSTFSAQRPWRAGTSLGRSLFFTPWARSCGGSSGRHFVPAAVLVPILRCTTMHVPAAATASEDLHQPTASSDNQNEDGVVGVALQPQPLVLPVARGQGGSAAGGNAQSSKKYLRVPKPTFYVFYSMEKKLKHLRKEESNLKMMLSLYSLFTPNNFSLYRVNAMGVSLPAVRYRVNLEVMVEGLRHGLVHVRSDIEVLEKRLERKKQRMANSRCKCMVACCYPFYFEQSTVNPNPCNHSTHE